MRVSAHVAAAGATDPGLHRETNEDRFHCDAARGVFFVVDGVGGHAAGDRAAEIARDVLRVRLAGTAMPVERRLRDAITDANNEIVRQASTRPEWSGMTCVLTAAVLDEQDVVVGHVGDTRLYKLRQGRIEKLTRDHSPVGEREDGRELSELEAMRHPRRNEVYRDVGSEPHGPADPGFVDVFRVSFEPDAALLLCTDGLTDHVTAAGITDVVGGLAGDPASVAEGLVSAANRAGGRDNVTVVYVEGELFARDDDTRDLIARSAAGAADSKRTPHAGHAGDSGRSGRPRWRVMALVLLLLVTIGVSGYELRKRWTPLEPLARLSTGAMQYSVAAGGSITAALARAVPGDEVVVEAGEYREQLTLKSGVRVRSRVARAASIRLPAGAAESDAAIVAVDVTGSELSGFRIVGDAATPLGTGVLVRNADVALIDLEVTGAQQAALEFAAGASGRLLASNVHGNPGAGLVVRAGSSPRIEHNTFRQNGSGSRAPGAVFIEPGAEPSVNENVFEGVSPAALGVPTKDEASVLRRNVFVPAATEPARGDPRSQRPARGQSRGPR